MPKAEAGFIAGTLGIGKQTLTGFLKKRCPALDAEATLKICASYKLPLNFQNQAIVCSNEVGPGEDPAVLQLQMDFDDSFELLSNPTPQRFSRESPRAGRRT